MDYPTQRHYYEYSQDNTWSPAYTPSSPATRLDGLPTCSEELVLVQSQEMDRPSTSLSQLKEENPVNSSLLSNYSQAKTIHKKAEYIDQSGDTELNTECKLYPYINIFITDTLLVESSCSTSDLEHLDYTSSRTLSVAGGAESDEAKSREPPSLFRGKKFTGMFYCRINILLLIYY